MSQHNQTARPVGLNPRRWTAVSPNYPLVALTTGGFTSNFLCFIFVFHGDNSFLCEWLDSIHVILKVLSIEGVKINRWDTQKPRFCFTWLLGDTAGTQLQFEFLLQSPPSLLWQQQNYLHSHLGDFGKSLLTLSHFIWDSFMKMGVKLQMEPGFMQHAHYGSAIFHPIRSVSKLVVISTNTGKSKSACRTASTSLLCCCSTVLKTFSVDNKV